MEILFYDHDLAVCVKPVGLDSQIGVPEALKAQTARGTSGFPQS